MWNTVPRVVAPPGLSLFLRRTKVFEEIGVVSLVLNLPARYDPVSG